MNKIIYKLLVKTFVITWIKNKKIKSKNNKDNNRKLNICILYAEGMVYNNS